MDRSPVLGRHSGFERPHASCRPGPQLRGNLFHASPLTAAQPGPGGGWAGRVEGGGMVEGGLFSRRPFRGRPGWQGLGRRRCLFSWHSSRPPGQLSNNIGRTPLCRSDLAVPQTRAAEPCLVPSSDRPSLAPPQPPSYFHHLAPPRLPACSQIEASYPRLSALCRWLCSH